MPNKYLFGPVNSRRLGISLGVDMVPFKTCSLDCIYCECGETTALTCERQEYVRAHELIDELNNYLSKKPNLDYITFAGSGEPTLNKSLGEVLRFVKKTYPQYKTALLTNGTLFYLPEVRKDALDFDLICPSLDAISDTVFKKVNRPQAVLLNKQIIDGLVEFSKMYKGLLWVEVFIVPGINDSLDELQRFKEILTVINPTRIQLNSLDRPGACEWVQPATANQLKDIASFLAPLPVEIISRSGTPPRSDIAGIDFEETITSLIRRRPSTVEELSIIAGKTINEIFVTLEDLKCKGIVENYKVNNQLFYKLCKNSSFS
jgi:wyosine [tRNA(Phe)-imidazoG37] synthetase (radical SAM superfamily)